MSLAFFDDPENRVALQICRTAPGYVPIVTCGKLHAVGAWEVHHRHNAYTHVGRKRRYG